MESSAYDQAAASVLADAWPLLEPHVREFVDGFYGGLWTQRGPSAVLGRLRPAELARLKKSQADHLRLLLDPNATEIGSRERARRIGRVHAMVGVETDWYADALGIYQAGILEVLSGWGAVTDRLAVNAVIGQRLMKDLNGVLTGYRDIDLAQARVMTLVNHVVGEAKTLPDLARGVCEALSSLDGIGVCILGRPDLDGSFEFEIGAGHRVEEFMAVLRDLGGTLKTTRAGTAEGNGPSGRAWRSGSAQRSDSYLTDETTRPWWPLGERFGWRSMVSIPLADAEGQPRAILTLYASWPGYFAYTARQSSLAQVKQLVERALVQLEARPDLTSGVSSYATRIANLAKLEAGEVVMVYQPMLQLPSGKLSKVEALARLGGDGGLVAPAEFLPALGDEELLRLFEIGLEQSCRALTRWEDEGLTTGVSLNLPAITSPDDRYVALVDRALSRHGIAASRLTLELLETGYIEGEPRWRRQILDEFKALGVRLAQDDLGAGYSSLLRMRHFAFDDVKIDQNLVRVTGAAPRGSLRFIRPLTSLAHSMGLQVVIEGLESAGLIEASLMLGADAGQGYGLARPMQADRVPAWARSFTLDIDPMRPRTSLGALAGHVAWEFRMTALGPGQAWGSGFGEDQCVLTAFIDEITGPTDALQIAHAAVHAAAVQERPGTLAHRTAWDVLTERLGAR